VTLKPGLGSFKVIGTDTYQSATWDFLLMFHSNYGPISYCFRDIRCFQSKIEEFSHPHVLFCTLLKDGIRYRHSETKT